jgi:hypothetical protein
MRSRRPARASAESIDEVDNGKETTARSRPDAASREGDRQMSLGVPGSADPHDVALLADEGAAGEVAHESQVDRRVPEGEVFDVLGEGWRW